MNSRNSSQQLKHSFTLLAASFLLFPVLSPALNLSAATMVQESTKSTEEYKEISVTGRVVCLDGSNKPLSAKGDCDLHKYKIGFLGDGEKLFTFWPEDTAGAMLADPRVSRNKLILTARLHVNDQLETIKVQAVREGKLFDLYYFCQVCNITAYAPGPCPCCYQELEFVERPAN